MPKCYICDFALSELVRPSKGLVLTLNNAMHEDVHVRLDIEPAVAFIIGPEV